MGGCLACMGLTQVLFWYPIGSPGTPPRGIHENIARSNSWAPVGCGPQTKQNHTEKKVLNRRVWGHETGPVGKETRPEGIYGVLSSILSVPNVPKCPAWLQL